jgi:hypothetical protein
MPFAIPIQAAIIGAGIGGGAQAIGSAFQSRATGQAANRQALASREAAQLQRQTAQEQLKFQREQSRYLMAQSERDREANYNQWLADQRNVELGGWDAAVNRRALTTRGARQQYAGELAQGRNAYDRWQNQQQRLGTIGQLTGGAPRQISGLKEAPYMPFDPLQRSERTYPDYVAGLTEAPPDPAIAANAARDEALRQGLTDEQYRARQAASQYEGYTPFPGRTV